LIIALAVSPTLQADVLAAGQTTNAYKELYFSGDYVGARDAVGRSIAKLILEKGPQTSIAWLLRDQGEIEHELGNVSDAISSYQSAISRLSSESIPSRQTVALFRLELAELQRLNGAYVESAESYEMAQLDLSREGAVLGTFEGITPLHSDGLLPAQLLAQIVDLWSPGQKMLDKFGRYTLVLMTRGDAKRNAAFATRLIDRFGNSPREHTKRVVDRIRDESTQEGIFYLPVTNGARFNARATLAANTSATEKWQQLSAYYDFDTAQQLYVDICRSTAMHASAVCKQSMPRGPLLITTTYPVDKTLMPETPMLLTDLTFADSTAFDPLVDEAVRKISEPTFNAVKFLDRVRIGFLQVLLIGAQTTTATEKSVSEIVALKTTK
jgi:tetratricopeptide (TPR) repeat protein